MNNFVIWAIIIVANLVFIFAGVYAIIKIVRAYTRGKDISKYLGYMVVGLLCIFVFPVIITSIGMFVLDVEESGGIVFTIAVQERHIISDSGRTSLTVVENEFNSTTEMPMSLSIKNSNSFVQNLNIDINCHSQLISCDALSELLVASASEVTIDPGLTIAIPITLNLNTQELRRGEYNYTFVVTDDSGVEYDSVNLAIQVN